MTNPQYSHYSSSSHPFFQFLSNPEKRQPLRFNVNFLSGLGIASRISAILPYGEAPESPELNSTALLERIGETIKDKVDDGVGLCFLQHFFFCQCFNQIRPIHVFPFLYCSLDLSSNSLITGITYTSSISNPFNVFVIIPIFSFMVSRE